MCKLFDWPQQCHDLLMTVIEGLSFSRMNYVIKLFSSSSKKTNTNLTKKKLNNFTVFT